MVVRRPEAWRCKTEENQQTRHKSATDAAADAATTAADNQRRGQITAAVDTLELETAEQGGGGGDSSSSGGSDGDDEDPLYLFRAGQVPGVETEIALSSHYFADRQRFSWDAAAREAAALFFVGPARAGAYMHQHSSAWNALVYGSKRWYLLPPNLDYRLQYASMGTWVREVLPELPYTPLECTQRAGEVLFVPEGWNHGVVNLANSVGIVFEVGVSTADWPDNS